MKKLTAIIFILTFMAYPAFTQAVSKMPQCKDEKVHQSLVQLNASFTSQGFELKKFQMLPLPSGSYVPLSEQLNLNNTYQFNLALPGNVKQLHYQIIDKNKKELTDKKIKSPDLEKGYHTFSFTPPYTGNFWLIISVKCEDKKDVVCGGISVLELSK